MTTPHYTEMRDSADPHAAGLVNWHGPVQGYANHIPPWTRADFARFPGGHMVTSVRPEASWAHVAREIDVETFAAMARDVAPFVLMRHHLGHDDGGVYFSLSRWPEIHDALLTAHITPDLVRLRVAAWDRPPERFDFGRGWIAWAHQFENDQPLNIDRTAVFGETDFTPAGA